MKTIAEFQKNALHLIKVLCGNFKGINCFSIWQFYKDDSDNWQASKQGITMSVDRLPEIRKALEKIQAEVDKEKSASD